MANEPNARALAGGAGTAPAGLATLPGLRTLRSPRFRALLAGTLWLAGALVLGFVLMRQAAKPDGQYAIDFGDYHAAAQRIVATGSPYAPDMLAGPVSAQGQDRYRYPPPLAQVLIPLGQLPLSTAAAIWLALQAAAMLAAVWIATGLGGAPRSLERLLWCGVAATWFMPVFDTLWKGNVSAVLALQVTLVAVGGAIGGVALSTAVLLKLAPLTLVPMGLAGGRRMIAGLLVTTAVVVGVSVLISPRAWSDYATVLPNLLAGDADQATNIAPSAVLSRLGLPDGTSTALRFGSLAVAGVLVIWSSVIARKPGGWFAAVALATGAMLLLPAALWYHYLCVLLPIAAIAWPGASRNARLGLFAGAAAIVVGIAWLPLACLGAIVLLGVSVTSLQRQSPYPVTVDRLTRGGSPVGR